MSNAVTTLPRGRFEEVKVFNFGGPVSMPSASTSSLDQEPLIVRTAGVCGGAARITKTRIPIWMLLESRDAGRTDKHFREDYLLSREALAAAWQYAAAHEAELRQQIKDNQEA